MQTLPAQITVSDQRAQRIMYELQFAIRQLSAAELGKVLLVDGVANFAEAVIRRGVNFGSLLSSIQKFTQSEFKEAKTAWDAGGDSFSTHAGKRIRDGINKTQANLQKVSQAALKVKDDPKSELLKLSVVAVAALASSGGLEGDGGLPDIDIPLMGIGAHRSPFTHSILIGAGAEVLIGTLIRVILLTHEKLPQQHDPVWDQFKFHSFELLQSIAVGTSIGVAYHLLIDGLLQPAPYHGLPFEMPIEVHQAILAANGTMESLDAFCRTIQTEKSAALLERHRSLAKMRFELDPELIEWLGPDETEILEQHGSWLLGLSIGEIAPYSEPQVNFILSAYQLNDARTAHEIAWRKFINIFRISLFVSDQQKYFFNRRLS